MIEIKKGQTYLCKKSVFINFNMDFSKDIIYKSEQDGRITNNYGKYIYMNLDDLNISFFDKHFELQNDKKSDEPFIDDQEEMLNFFPKDDPCSLKLPDHYNNDNGSLYLIAEQRGWDAYQFDIIKRIDRCNKKGEFLSDLEKTKFLIDLYIKEKQS